MSKEQTRTSILTVSEVHILAKVMLESSCQSVSDYTELE